MDVRLRRTDNLSNSLKTSVIRHYPHSLGRNQETTQFRVLKLIFVKRIIQRIPTNHYMCFNLNHLKVLEH